MDKDSLAMELINSQPHGEIRTDTLIISNIVTEGVSIHDNLRIKKEQLHYFLAGALAPFGLQVTQEGLQGAWNSLCIFLYITAARPENLRAWTFYRLPQ